MDRGDIGMKLKITGDTAGITEGLIILSKELGFQLSDDGYPIQVTKRLGPLHVKNVAFPG